MDVPENRYKVSLDAGLEQEGPSPEGAAEVQDAVFHIGIMGDFSARSGSSGPATPHRSPVQVDADNIFDLAGYAPDVVVDDPSGRRSPLTIGLSSLDDFTPDRLYEVLDAAGWLEPDVEAPPASQAEPVASDSRQAADGPALLDSILHQSDDQPSPVLSGDALETFIEGAVRTHKVPERPQAEAQAALAEAERAIATLRTVLHHPALRAAEELWSGVYFLVRRCVAARNIRLHLIDVAVEDLTSEDQVADALHQYATASLQGESFSLLISTHDIGRQPSDVPRYDALAKVATRMGAPCLASSRGVEHLTGEPWDTLRNAPQAESLSVLFPRFLLRAPYGADGEPTELAGFEEVESGATEEFLWGSPVFPGALVFARTWSTDGRRGNLGQGSLIDELPIVTPREGFADGFRGCLDAPVDDAAAVDLVKRGITPLRPSRRPGEVLLGGFQSVANRPTESA